MTRATTRGKKHQPLSASAPRLWDSPEREPWELAQNQPGQVPVRKNNLNQINKLEGAVEAAEWWEQRLMELLRRAPR